MVGEAAPEYGAPGTALETKAGNVHYWQWNVTVEHELFRNTVVELAYVGSKGLGLLGQTNLNEVPPENRLAYAQTRRRRPSDRSTAPPASATADLPLWQHDRNSIYHGLQVALNSRFGHGSVLALAYTWSKLITHRVANADGRQPGFDSTPLHGQHPAEPQPCARAAPTARHMFNASLVLALPTLQDKSPFVRHVLGDWEFTTIVQAGTGYPVTVSASASRAQWLPGAPASVQRARRRTG